MTVATDHSTQDAATTETTTREKAEKPPDSSSPSTPGSGTDMSETGIGSKTSHQTSSSKSIRETGIGSKTSHQTSSFETIQTPAVSTLSTFPTKELISKLIIKSKEIIFGKLCVAETVVSSKFSYELPIVNRKKAN